MHNSDGEAPYSHSSAWCIVNTKAKDGRKLREWLDYQQLQELNLNWYCNVPLDAKKITDSQTPHKEPTYQEEAYPVEQVALVVHQEACWAYWAWQKVEVQPWLQGAWLK